MSVKINDVQEPYYSSRQLEIFEETYGFTSEYFYEHYWQGELLIEDEYEAAEWAFEYEVNRRAKEKEFKERNHIDYEDDSGYGSSLLYDFKLMWTLLLKVEIEVIIWRSGVILKNF